MDGMSDIRNEIEQRLGVFARPGEKAAFGVWGDAPDKYRAAIDFIQNQRSPSSAAMNDLKKAIKAAQAEATKVRDPKLKRTYEDDAGSLQNVLEYAQRGDRSTLLRAAYNLDTAVRDDIPVEMFIWAGADVNWQHRNAKSLLDTVSALVARSKQRASRPGAKEEMGRAEDLYRKLNVSVTLANSKEMERLASEALRMPDFMPENNDWSLHELAEEAGREVLALKSRASRPGAKAAMARWEEKHAQGWGDLSKSLTATINGTRWEIVVDASTGKGQLMRATARGPQVVKEGPVDQLKRYAETVKASRPNEKSTAAKADDKTECADCETEQDKAGLKLMEKADKAVSDKIRKLIKEGKPQDQAVAIALDMKRRGEL